MRHQCVVGRTTRAKRSCLSGCGLYANVATLSLYGRLWYVRSSSTCWFSRHGVEIAVSTRWGGRRATTIRSG